MPLLSKKKLSALRDFVFDQGEFDDDAVAKFLEIPVTEVHAISDQLRREYPDDFGAPDEPEPEAASEQPAEPPVYQLVDEHNLLKDLEVVRVKGSRVILRLKEPKDLVTLIVKGETVEVDLIRLRKLKSDDVLHGVTVARLIELAEIAKG